MSKEKTWANGWRVVLTCNECKLAIWSKNIGQTCKCECDVPNYITDNPNYYTDGGNKNYGLKLMRVEQPY